MSDRRASRAPIELRAGGARLRVFFAGARPRLRQSDEAGASIAVMRGVHTHFTYEIFFVTDGKMQLITEGRAVEFSQEIVIVPPGIKHYSINRNCESYCLLFEIEGGTAEEESRSDELLRRISKGIFRLSITEEEGFYISAFDRACDEDGAYSSDERYHLAALLFGSIVSRILPYSSERKIASNGARAYVSEIDEFINNNMSNKICVSDVAEHINLSVRQLSRVVRRDYGCTVSELILRKKLSVAELLLVNTDLKVSEISKRVNVGADNYFFSLFYARYGMTPLKYRALRRSEENNAL